MIPPLQNAEAAVKAALLQAKHERNDATPDRERER